MIVEAGMHHPGEVLEVGWLGVGVAKHGLEMVAPGVVRARKHQLLLEQSLASAIAPGLAAGSIKLMGGEGQQMEGATDQLQPLVWCQ